MFMVRFQVLKNSRVDAGAALEKTMHCLSMQPGKNAPCKPLRPCDGEHEERLRQEAQRLDSHAQFVKVDSVPLQRVVQWLAACCCVDLLPGAPLRRLAPLA